MVITGAARAVVGDSANTGNARVRRAGQPQKSWRADVREWLRITYTTDDVRRST